MIKATLMAGKTIKGFLFGLCLLFAGISVFSNEPLNLDHIFKQYLFNPYMLSGYNSLNDGVHYTVLERRSEIVQYDYTNGTQVVVLFSTDWIEDGSVPLITGYQFSESEKRILLSTEKELLYRHSFYSNYYVFDVDTRDLIEVFPDAMQRLAKLSPDGSKVAFVSDNNIYVKDLHSNSLAQITKDGVMNRIINGVPDWVYEEEFTQPSGYEWSPDSKKIAYYRFDETEVPEYSIAFWNDLYPYHYQYKYPKAGEKNSLVDIYTYDLELGESMKINTGSDPERYVPRIKWLPNSSKICVLTLNRLQNELDILLCSPSNGTSRVLYHEKDSQYITEVDDKYVTFLSDSNKVLIKSESSGFMHLYLYDLAGNLIHAITSGKWEVDELVGIDEENELVYYSSTEVSPLERHVYSIKLDGTGKTQISKKKGTNTAQFSTNFKYYLLTHSDANTPPSFSVFSNEGELVRTVNDNTFVKANMVKYSFSPREFFTIETERGDTLNAYRILPRQFNKKKKYPVFVYVYGGPETQRVKDEWYHRIPWFQMLAQRGYIVVCLDNRGTDGRGAAFKKSTYMQLGKLETEDHISLAKYLTNLNYVDRNRIGIFGWSYGGYMSLLCLTKGNEYFKMGISVAPITNWRFYDTVYTERFMRKPQENGDAYDSNSPLSHISDLQGKLLLIHGMGDDNVHLQNSTMLIDELVNQNKQFEMQFYPNKNHSIYGGNTTYHLYTRMTNYIFENL